MKKQWVDHLYQYITVDEDTLKVVNESPLCEDLNRLSKISQIGLASKIFNSATHTKLDHALGVYYLTDYALENKDVSTGHLKKLSLKIAALIHGIGHFPFSFATEKAIQKSSFFCDVVDEFVSDQLESAFEKITIHQSEKEKGNFHEKVFEKKAYINHFYRLFTVKRLIEMEDKVKEASSDLSGFNFLELLKYLSLPENAGFKLLHHLDRLDYILRDMHNFSYIRVDLNLPYYFSNLSANKSEGLNLPPEWEVLDELETYAKKNIYNDGRVKTLETIYGKILTKAIMDSEIALGPLLKMRDQEMEERLAQYQERKEHRFRLFDEIERIKSRPDSVPKYDFSVSARESNTKNLLLVEGRKKNKIGDYFKNDLNRSIDKYWSFKGAFVDSFKGSTDINGTIVSLDKQKIGWFLKEVADFEEHYGFNRKRKIAECIWGNKHLELHLDRYKPVTSRIAEVIKNEKSVNSKFIYKRFLEKDAPSRVEDPEEVENLVTDIAELFFKPNKSLDVYHINNFLAKYTENLFKNNNFLNALGFTDQDDFLDFIKKFHGARAKKEEEFKEIAWEYYIYVKEMRKAPNKSGYLKSWIFPRTRILPRGEADVWRVDSFRNRRPIIKLIECSLSTSATKNTEAQNNLSQLKHKIREEYQKKIEVNAFYNEEKLSI